MNKQELLKLNVVPEGKEPWLDYESYLKLSQLLKGLEQPGKNDMALYETGGHRDLYK